MRFPVRTLYHRYNVQRKQSLFRVFSHVYTPEESVPICIIIVPSIAKRGIPLGEARALPLVLHGRNAFPRQRKKPIPAVDFDG